LYVLLSLVWPHQHSPESERLVWSNPLAALQGDAWPGLGNYKVLAALLTVIMIALYAIFR
jgi:SSS family solute:Na+ symporter